MRLSWQQAGHGQRLRITVHFDGKKIGRSKRARCTILVIHAAPEDEALHEETENRNTNLASRGTKQTKARRRSSWIGSSSTMFSRFFHKSPPQQRPQQQDVVQDSFPSPNFDPRVALHHGVPSTASILAFDNIQRLLAVGTLDGKIKLFGGDNIEGTLISPKQASFKNLEFLENQGFLASVSSDNEIQVWDLKSKQIASALQWESVITSFSVIMAPVTYGNTSDLSAEKLTSNSPLKSDSRMQANIQSENAQVEFETKSFKVGNADQNANQAVHTNRLENLKQLFSSPPFLKSSSSTVDKQDPFVIDIDDIQIDEPVVFSSPQKIDIDKRDKGKGTDRQKLLEEVSTDSKPKARTAEEIKAKYRKTGDASAATALARDKLVERQEKLQVDDCLIP
ncbi:hypothetical protein JHK82_038910 [Glycine max]|nr:hypothetical protein JHK86_039088 [Glycine max]KAG4964696.1 hypothetical protein JHK85_039671 [Glycine max]KAG5109687.1 hypothetical protein JHK82_038910 [Glycine max]KAG5120976.1 hypothetical protein JHK84_039316 [Glycine max]